MAKKGREVTFHGAFSKKEDAVKKEKQVGGFIQEHKMKGGHRRFVVMTENKR